MDQSKGNAFVVRTLLVAALALAAFPAPAATPQALPPPGVYALDPPHTFASFAAQHLVVGMVRGRFDTIRGTITVSKDLAACAVDVSIAVPSVSTQNSVRDEDLRSDHFFEAAKFPAMTYQGRGIHRSGKGWVMEGSLTIRGVTKTVPLTFVFRGVAPAKPGQPARVAFHASAAVRRAEFGMTYELLDEIGAVSARPDVWIEIDAEALATGSPN
ncbi:MAG: YceI family protein [Acidobacteria bacterium]|nr:YceI family protein [Acidobacteriota bacterium]